MLQSFFGEQRVVEERSACLGFQLQDTLRPNNKVSAMFDRRSKLLRKRNSSISLESFELF